MTCDHCDGTGQIWESCACSACEYDRSHSRYIECANCDGVGRVALKCPIHGPIRRDAMRHESHSQIPYCGYCGSDLV